MIRFRNIFIFSVFVMMCCHSGKIYAQTYGFHIDSERKSTYFKYESYNELIVVPLTINQSLTLKFILDSGARNTILSIKQIGDILGLKYERRYQLVGADRKTVINALLVRNNYLELPGVTASSQPILVLEEDYLKFDQYTGFSLHGIIGADIFTRFVVKLNYKSGIVHLYEPAYFEPPGKRYIGIPIRIENSKPYIELPVVFTDGTRSKIKMLIDTGAGFTLLLHWDKIDSLHISGDFIKGSIGLGLGGALEGYMGRVSRLSIGDFYFDNLITQFQLLDETIDTAASLGEHGIIGAELLSRFNVIFDYGNQMMYLRPDRNYNRGFKMDRSGIVFLASGETLDVFTVYDVLPGSPADQAGVIKGDVLHKINKRKFQNLQLLDITNMLQDKEGKLVKLELIRDEVKVKIEFELEDLF